MWASVLSIPITHIGAFALISPLPWILPRRLRSPWSHIVGFVLSVVTCELVSALLPVIDAWFFSHETAQFNLRKIVDLYISFVGPAMMIVGGLIAARARSEDLRRASESEAQIAKNRLLQGQVHPHVLFNALNGLAELIYKDQRAAERAVRHLSDLLRRILVATEHARLPLGEERKIVADYLALESIRLGTRLRVVWEWDESLDAVELPPLLLQPLVENAIKHGIAPSVPGGDLILRAQSRDGAISLEVWNSGMPYQNRGAVSGIGIKNLRARLALNLGQGATLSIGPSGQGTLACIRIEATQVEFIHETAESPSR
jgi:LytS/YehU family sensor histidine kinase